jgi:pimeloyl-ACP methyl ester carboxylesterase
MPRSPSRQVIFARHPGAGPLHTVCLPGLVPDGPIAYLRQRHLLARHGSVALATWPADAFDLDLVIAGIEAEIAQAQRQRRPVVLAAMSFGGGIALELLRRRRETGGAPELAGLILISPLTSTADLSRSLQRFVTPIMEACLGSGGDPHEALERGRAFFRTLASRSVEGPPESSGWLAPLKAWTPAAFAARQERELRDRVIADIAALPAEGSLQRVLAMRAMRGLPANGPLAECPALVLWGSKERHTLDMEGPGAGRLCRPDLAYRQLPAAEIHWVWDEDGQAVPHASTLRHHAAFNLHLERFLQRLAPGQAGAFTRVANLIPFRRATDVASA